MPEYLRFRRRYSKMLKGARKEMDTPLQVALVDSVVAVGFSAGFQAGLLSRGKPKPPNSWSKGPRR